jgi:hypothetical protein
MATTRYCRVCGWRRCSGQDGYCLPCRGALPLIARQIIRMGRRHMRRVLALRATVSAESIRLAERESWQAPVYELAQPSALSTPWLRWRRA